MDIRTVHRSPDSPKNRIASKNENVSVFMLFEPSWNQQGDGGRVTAC